MNSARLASIKANSRGPFELWPFAGALHSGFSGPCSINSSRAIGKCTENVAVSPAEQAASCSQSIFCSTVPGDTASHCPLAFERCLPSFAWQILAVLHRMWPTSNAVEDIADIGNICGLNVTRLLPDVTQSKDLKRYIWCSTSSR